MSLERLRSASRKIELLGFTTEPNVAAPMLEKALGIVIDNPPAHISLEKRINRVSSWARLKNLGFNLGVDGSFDKGLNAQFLSYNPHPLLVGMHESMHGWVNEKNPEMSIAFGLKTALTQKILGFTPDMWQLIIAFKCAQEGLAEFGSITTAIDLDTVDARWAKHVQSTYRREKSRFRGFVTQSKLNGRLFSSDLTIDYINALNHSYGAGYCFVEDTLDRLMKTGTTIAQGLELIAKEPPIDTNEISDPSIYLERVA